jgi:OHCU decarboxylase
MAAHSFPNTKEVFATCDSIWRSLKPEDWKEAFHAHPKAADRGIHHLTREEQVSARHASGATLTELRQLAQQYEERFGYPFIVHANGRSAHSILEDLKTRLGNDPETELRIAAGEQLQLTHARLRRLLTPLQ